MPNLYLRVPTYIAAFYRHRDEKKPLTEWQPITFEEFSFEQRLLRNGLCSDKRKNFLSVLCYSTNSWNNICNGKLPTGGKVILTRDQKKWPDATEIVALEGRALKPNEEIFDYLCIALPGEAIISGRLTKTDNSCTIDGATAKKFVNVMRDEFYHYYFEWCIQEERMFSKRGFMISKAEMMERFYAQYEIPMPKGSCSQNTLRVIAKRLYDRGKVISTKRTHIDGEYFSYVGENNEPKKRKGSGL